MAAPANPISFKSFFTRNVLDFGLEECCKKHPVPDEKKDTLASAAPASNSESPSSSKEPIHDPAAIKRYASLTESQQSEWNQGLKFFQEPFYPTDFVKLTKALTTVDEALQMLNKNVDLKIIMWNLASNFSSAQMQGFEAQAKLSLDDFKATLQNYLGFMKFSLEHDEAERFSKIVKAGKSLSDLQLESIFRTLSPKTKALLLDNLHEDVLLSDFRKNLSTVVDSYQLRYKAPREKLEKDAAAIADGFIEAHNRYLQELCTIL